jgi:hypothetical protein
LTSELPLGNLHEVTRRRIVAHWLQRSLDLPIPLPSPGFRLPASGRYAAMDDIVAVADRLDLNVAIVDEFLDRYGHEGAAVSRASGDQRD